MQVLQDYLCEFCEDFWDEGFVMNFGIRRGDKVWDCGAGYDGLNLAFQFFSLHGDDAKIVSRRIENWS